MRLASSLCVLALAATLGAHTAAAQSAEAEALFRDGKALLKEGKIEEACEKLDASERLESSVGTLLNLADCREKNGQIATAWATFVKAAAEARRNGDDGKREKEANKRAKALESRLSYLTVSVPETSKVEGLVISRAGVPLDAALWNTSAPIDAGTYEITAQAPGREPWSTEVTVAEGDKASIEVPRFKSVEEMTPSEPVRPQAPPAKTPRERHAAKAAARHHGTFTGMRWGAVGAGVAGLVAIAAGGWRGLAARDLEAQSNEVCPGTTCDDPRGLSLNAQARSAALQSNVLFVAGGVAVASAVALWFLGAPHDAEAPELTATIAPGEVGFTFTRSF